MGLLVLVNEFVYGLVAKDILNAPFELFLVIEIIRPIEVLPRLVAFPLINKLEHMVEYPRSKIKIVPIARNLSRLELISA